MAELPRGPLLKLPCSHQPGKGARCLPTFSSMSRLGSAALGPGCSAGLLGTSQRDRSDCCFHSLWWDGKPRCSCSLSQAGAVQPPGWGASHDPMSSLVSARRIWAAALCWRTPSVCRQDAQPEKFSLLPSAGIRLLMVVEWSSSPMGHSH